MTEEKIKRYEQISDWDDYDNEILNRMHEQKNGDWCRSSDVTALEEELDGGKFALHTAGETISSLESELSRLREELEISEKEVLRLKEEYSRESCELQDALFDCDKYRRKIEQLREEVYNWRRNFDQLDFQHNAVCKEIFRKDLTIDQMKNEIAARGRENTELREENEKMLGFRNQVNHCLPSAIALLDSDLYSDDGILMEISSLLKNLLSSLKGEDK